MRISDYSFSIMAIFQNLERRTEPYSATTRFTMDGCYCFNISFMGKPVIFCIFSSPLRKNSKCSLLFQIYGIDGGVGELESAMLDVESIDSYSIGSNVLRKMQGRIPYKVIKEAVRRGLI